MADKPNVTVDLTDYERAMVHAFLSDMGPKTGARLSAEAQDRIYDLMMAIGATTLEGPSSLKDTKTTAIALPYRDAEWLRNQYQESNAHAGGLALGLVPSIRKLRKAILAAEEAAKAGEAKAAE